ncbi:MAG: class I SAM-dependent methyltransferase [Planctomycetia bacterium]|nr:class I SAM-dependent methyltransferase [Planctomycetia bacterium]
MADVAYTDQFFAYHRDGSLKSAREVIPVVWQFVQPKSVVDVGCGIGTWLSEFKNAGVADCLGIDGDYVDRKQLMVEPDRFQARDLEKPLNLDRRFDLAVSLEVAEHLPAASADTFIESLTRLSSVVLFSAAIPHQGGTNHINEQWPEYWQERFRRHGYVVVDCLRRLLWRNSNVMQWYRQNLLFYVDRTRLADYPQLASAFEKAGENPLLSIVHPEYYLGHIRWFAQQLHEAQRTAWTYALRLRQINLAAFPDWTQSPELIAGQLRGLLSALSTHPDKQRMAIVVHAGTTNHEKAGRILGQVSAEVLNAGGMMTGQGPEISMIGGQFAQWQALWSCLAGRVVLPHEDVQAVVSTGAQALRTIPLSVLQNRQPLTP